MEADRLSPDIPEPAASEDRSSSSSSPRTFDCTYCKRGFSNAQALGGHMNIHRKNRAKIIKQPSALAQLTLDIHSNPFPSYPLAPTSYVPQLSHGSDDGSCSLKWQSVLPREHDVHRATHLSLLAETQSGEGDQSSISSHERKREERSGHGAGAAEVDLELRLGLEPPDATMGKKGFV